MGRRMLMGCGRGNAGVTPSLLTDLVSYWKLDEASGTRFDSAGSNNLADNNTVTSDTGKINSAAKFVAANSEYLSIASNATLVMGDIDFTLSLWFYRDTSANFTLLAKDNGTSREYNLDIGGGNARFFINGGTSLAQSAAASLATWYHVIAWHDSVGNTVNISVNNAAPASTATGGAAPATGASQFRLGSREGDGHYWDGRIDGVGVWKRVLTSDERTSLYNGGSGLDYPFA
jgi:hypothetical protein